VKIADLFVNLGLKGGDQTKQGLGGVRNSMSDLKSMSLEAKAAILAVVYGLQHYMRQSGGAGAALNMFGAATGLSTKALQQWQYAIRQVGGEAEDVTASVRAVQNSITQMNMGMGSPKGMGVIADHLKELGGFDETKLEDTFYVMERLQKFATTANLPANYIREMISSFGVNDNTVGAMMQNAFDPSVLSKAQVYTDGQIKSLTAANAAWGNLGDKIEKAFGAFNAKHGQGLVQDIAKIVESIAKLAESLITLSERLKIFEAVKWVLEGMDKGVKGTNSLVEDGGDLGSGIFGDKKRLSKWWEKRKEIFQGNVQAMGEGNFFDHKYGVKSKADLDSRLQNFRQSQGGVNNNINITNHGVENKDLPQTVEKSLNRTYQQMSGRREDR
jgi:hypothetical protein